MLWLILLPVIAIGAYFTWRNLTHFVSNHPSLAHISWTHDACFWIVGILCLLVLAPFGHFGLPRFLIYAIWGAYAVFGINFLMHAKRWIDGAKKAEHDHDVEEEQKHKN